MKNNYIKISLIVLIILSIFIIIKPNKKQEVNVINEEKEYSKFAIYKEETRGGVHIHYLMTQLSQPKDIY